MFADQPLDARVEVLKLGRQRDVKGQPWRPLVIFYGPKDGAPTEYQRPR